MLEPGLQALTEEVESRRTWSFDTTEDQWQHDVLAELIGSLERLEAGLLADDATPPDHGWSVPKRLAFARELEAGFAEGGEFAQAWEEALPAIREVYPGLDLTPQMGLLPIGPDPGSGLWEFAHLMTGLPAERGSDGKLLLTEETGVVLVLLPAGTFWMGAQSGDPDGRNYDPQAGGQEGPVHEVELSAFFTSKYEMTQGQWLRSVGRNPSAYSLSGLHPVEEVTWWSARETLARQGLELPSEAQWEYACRAGTSSVWWSGDGQESLQGVANLRDHDDGQTMPVEIGSYRANGFGLHDMHGNVLEWCLDGADSGFYGRSSMKDPLSDPEGYSDRVLRGGSFWFEAADARSAHRGSASPGFTFSSSGVRAARAFRTP